MLISKKRLDRNYEIVKNFMNRYPEEIRQMTTDLAAVCGHGEVPEGVEPANSMILDDGICNRMEDVLTGKKPIELFMLMWTFANFHVGLNQLI